MATGREATEPDRAEVKVARLDAPGADQLAAPVARLDGLGAGAGDSAPVAGLDDLPTGPGRVALPAQVADLGTVRSRRGRPAAAPGPDEETRAPRRQDQDRVVPRSDSGTGAAFRERPPPAGTAPEGGGAPRKRRRRPERPPESAARGGNGRRTNGRAADRAQLDRAQLDPAQLDPDADPVAVAREICLRLLTDRARTRHELAQALQRKGVPPDAAEQVLGRFDEVGLIDDAAFAGQWVRSRHGFRGLGRRAIAMELRRKGVADEVAGEALAEIDTGAEARRARELVDRKLRSLTVVSADDRAVAARRLVGMLARKGYGAGTAYAVVREALAAHGADLEELGAAEPVDD